MYVRGLRLPRNVWRSSPASNPNLSRQPVGRLSATARNPLHKHQGLGYIWFAKVKLAANSDKRRVFLTRKQWRSILDTYAFSIGIRHNFDSLELE